MGGLLSNPVVLYPRVFGHIQLFEHFPYLLPNLVISAFSVVSLIIIIKYLPETLNKASDGIASDRDEVVAINESDSSCRTFSTTDEITVHYMSTEFDTTTASTASLSLSLPTSVSTTDGSAPFLPSSPSSPSPKSDNSLYGLLLTSGVPAMLLQTTILFSNWGLLTSVHTIVLSFYGPYIHTVHT